MYRSLPRSTVLRVYVLAVLTWALFGAFAGWTLVTLTLGYVSHTEGIPFTPLAWDGFLTLVCAFGAFVGGASGVEAGQQQALRMEIRYRNARRMHPASQPVSQPAPVEPPMCGDECYWDCEHSGHRAHSGLVGENPFA